MRWWIIAGIAIISIVAFFALFPSQVSVQSGLKENESLEKLYRYKNVSWNIVIPTDSGYLLEKNGRLLYVVKGREVSPKLVKLSEWNERINDANVRYEVYGWRNLRFVLVNVSFGNLSVSTLGLIEDGRCLATDCFGSKPVVRYYNVSSTMIRNVFQLDDEIFYVLIFANLSARCLTKPLPPPSPTIPVPPDIGEFVEALNEKNWTKAYGFYSERIRMNHSLDELGGLRIVSWEILRENLSSALVRFEFDVNGTPVNRTIEIPFVYKTVKSYEWITVDGMRFRHGLITPIGYIDKWISWRR